MLPLSRIVSQRSPWQMYTLATRPTRLFGVGHVSCCTRIKLIAGLTRFTGVALIIALKLGHVAVSKIERMIKIGFGFFTAVVFGRTDHRLIDPKRKGRSTESDCKITLVISIRNFLC